MAVLSKPNTSLLSLVLLLTTPHHVAAQSSATISPQAKASSVTTIPGVPLSRSYTGFGIEPSNLYSFTGGSTSNAMSLKLFQNLADYAGAPPPFRIGGNTADYFLYDSSMNNWRVANTANPSGKGAVPWDLNTIGPRYWQAIDRLPANSPIIFCLNLAYDDSDWQDRITTMATAAVEGISSTKLTAFEVGNEPDLYYQNAFRSTSYGAPNFATEWKERAQTVVDNVLNPKGMNATFFEPPATASTIGNGFDIANLVKLGIRDGNLVAAWNQHDYYYFISVSTYTLTLQSFSQLSTTETQFAAWRSEVRAAANTGVPYHLREMASSGPVGFQGVSDTYAAALWTLNFICYAASLGISSVQFHLTDNSWAAPWQPVRLRNTDPFVRPSYAGFAAWAQTIGALGENARVAALTVEGYSDAARRDFVRAYALYNGDDLAGLVIINATPRNASTPASSTLALSLTLTLPSAAANSQMHVSRLVGTGSDATSGASFAGVEWESSGDGSTKTSATTTSGGRSVDQSVTVGSGGRVTLEVGDAEAVVATLGFSVKGGTSGSTAGTAKKSAAVRGQVVSWVGVGAVGVLAAVLV